MTNQTELVKVIEESGLEAQTSNYIKEKFLPFFEQAEEWKQKASMLVVTDASQVHDMKMARTARLALKEIRVNADKTRKALKEDSLRYGKAVQGVYNVIEYLIAPIERHLQEQEDFVAIAEAKRKAELKASREMDLQPYAEFVPYGVMLGEMSEEDYQKLLTGAKLQLQAKIDAEKKAEAERIEAERLAEIARQKAEAERKAIEAENKRLKAEAEAAELKAKKEREIAQAKIKAEQDAKLALEKQLREKEAAEKKAAEAAAEAAEAERRAKAEAERKAKAAPDKLKLNEFAKVIASIELPELKSDEAKQIAEQVQTLLSKVVLLINDKTSNL